MALKIAFWIFGIAFGLGLCIFGCSLILWGLGYVQYAEISGHIAVIALGVALIDLPFLVICDIRD
ncbi:hypothetical protein KAR91_19720 [Candidatus Pacearchaeota archaeon]|nr:hypothetical protein [Candidatus Pacearchaeota archaeon]